MKIKKNDEVIVISGKDKGKTGKVVKSLPRDEKVIVAGVNLKKIHKRATKSNQKGQIIEQSSPIHVSNVMMVDPKNNKRTRIQIKKDSGKRERVAKKSGTIV